MTFSCAPQNYQFTLLQLGTKPKNPSTWSLNGSNMHKDSFAQKVKYTIRGTFAQRDKFAQRDTLAQKEIFAQRDIFAQRHFYTKTLLQEDIFI